MNCLQCSKLTLKGYERMAKEGFGRCPTDPSGAFVQFSIQRTCGKFAAAKPEVVAAREVWDKKRMNAK